MTDGLIDRLIVVADETIVEALNAPMFALDFATPGERVVSVLLAILAKPENITPEMVNALIENLDWMRCAEYGDMRSVKDAIAASIASLLKTEQDKP